MGIIETKKQSKIHRPEIINTNITATLKINYLYTSFDTSRLVPLTPQLHRQFFLQQLFEIIYFLDFFHLIHSILFSKFQKGKRRLCLSQRKQPKKQTKIQGEVIS